jgi:TIR domain-containing protein
MTETVARRAPDLFLCHSHQDKPFVRRLARDLHELYIYAWFDEWELAPGASLHGSIGSALEAASYVGVVLTRNSITSKWCRKELNQALSREDRQAKAIVLPILVESVEIPAFLEEKLWLDMSADYFVGITKLAGHILGVDRMQLAQILAEVSPQDIDHARKVLQAAGWSSTKQLGANDWQVLRETLERHKIVFPEDDEISIFSHKTRQHWGAK